MKRSFDIDGIKFTVKFLGTVCFLYFFASVTTGVAFRSIYNTDSTELVSTAYESVASNNSSEVVLGFVGDIMLDRGVEKTVSTYEEGDFNSVFVNVEKELSELDLLFGNLEGPVSDKGRDLGGLYSFRMHPGVIQALSRAGFDVLSVSNNHSGDYGEEALKDTILRLENVGIVAVGAGLSKEEAYQPEIVTIKGLNIAVLSFAENLGMYKGQNVALATVDNVRDAVTSVREAGLAKFIVVHFHFGDEYQSSPNDKQKELARLSIDAGANLVVGTHPHVTQTIEKYNGGVIVYSLGNFVFDQKFSKETMQGWLVKAHVRKTQLYSMEFCTIVLNQVFQPVKLTCKTNNI